MRDANATQWKLIVRRRQFLLTLAASPVLVSAARATDAVLPKRMRAIQFAQYGPPDVLRLVELPRPEPAAGEVLVRVRAAGVNPVDWKIRDGSLGHFAAAPPLIPGFDFAGDVVALGAGVDSWRVGQDLFGRLPAVGAYAEFLAVRAEILVRKPANIDYAEAAAVPTAALTAYECLFDRAGLKAGEKVLIHGASGGVGHYAVQLARNAGAHVIGIASGRNRDFVLGLGAAEFIDYRTQKFEELVSEVDVVLDAVGGDTSTRSLNVMKRGGRIIAIAGGIDAGELERRGLSGGSHLVGVSRANLLRLAVQLADGSLRSIVSERIPLAEAARAHALSEAGGTRGKIVLMLD
jgi:NADPH:quinone reductase-like Zn-dependent oxidoreductase